MNNCYNTTELKGGIRMNIYQIPWLFHLDYDHISQKITIRLSEVMRNKINTKSEKLLFSNSSIHEFIHKYDYRKLSYFVALNPSGTFDTLMRFKFQDQKGYIKTQAVCEMTPKGFSCVHIEVLDIIKTKKRVYLDLYQSSGVKIILRDDQILKETVTNKLSAYKNQLENILQR
jgi:hypothetical protein